MIGRCVSRYQIIDKLGEGGMATVWKAEDPLLGRVVALKLLAPDLRSSPDARRRFLREAKAVSQLSHPGICAVHDTGDADDQTYIAFACVDGQTVSALAERSPLAIEDVIRIGIEGAEALGHAHAHGVIHRDVTGRNIMVARDGRVVVLDFGLALAVGSSRHTTSGGRIGTIAYLSPEAASGGMADARSDLYGLGVVLYEAATGTLPFEHERVEALLYSIVHLTPEPPGRRRRDLPADLERIVLRLLAKQPEERHASAAELAAELRRLPRPALVTAEAPRWREAPSAPGTPDRQRYVAVLPLEIASAEADREQALLLAGLADAVASSIARAPGLHVVPPALAAREDLTGDFQQVARQLGVSLLWRGRARRSGLQLRITWELLDPARGIQVGGETVEGAAADAFGLEDRLVASVIAALGCEAPGRPTRSPRDPAAHERFLQGMGYLQRYEDEGSIDAALAIFERLRTSEAKNAAYEAALGRACLHKYQLTHESRWEGLAAAACERAIAIDPASPDVRVTLGELYERTGQIARSIEAYEQSLTMDPDRPEALIGLGRALISAGRLDEAERTLRRATELRPGYWGSHNALGRFLLRVGRYDEARLAFERVVQLTPDNARGWRNLGNALARLERHEEAIEALRRSIELRQDERAHSTLGSVLFSLGRYPEAATAFERAVALRPADAVLWGNLGSACRFMPGHEGRMQETLEKAVGLIRQELEHNPRDARTWDWLGGWLSNLERHAEAREAIERAMSLEPANPEYRFHAGVIAHQAGDRERALRLLEESLEHGYPHPQLERDPYLTDLRDDPEFRRIAERARRHPPQHDARRGE